MDLEADTRVPAFRSRASVPDHRSTPRDSTSATVPPSTPAARPLRRTACQATVSTSSNHTLSLREWNRKSGASFAFACSTMQHCLASLNCAVARTLRSVTRSTISTDAYPGSLPELAGSERKARQLPLIWEEASRALSNLCLRCRRSCASHSPTPAPCILLPAAAIDAPHLQLRLPQLC